MNIEIVGRHIEVTPALKEFAAEKLQKLEKLLDGPLEVHVVLAVEKHLMVKRGLFPSARRRKPYGWELDAETADEVDRLFDRMLAAIG